MIVIFLIAPNECILHGYQNKHISSQGTFRKNNIVGLQLKPHDNKFHVDLLAQCYTFEKELGGILNIPEAGSIALSFWKRTSG